MFHEFALSDGRAVLVNISQICFVMKHWENHSKTSITTTNGGQITVDSKYEEVLRAIQSRMDDGN